VLPTSGDSFPHLIQKRRSQLGFVTYLLTYLRNKICWAELDVIFLNKNLYLLVEILRLQTISTLRMIIN